MDFAEITEALQHLTQPAYLYIGGGAIVCAFLLILLVRRQPKKVVAYVTENGRVMVSRSAIIELVQTSCQQLNDVSKPHVRIQQKGKITHLDGGRLRSVEETLQAHLRHALTENLGIEHLGRINIVATGFKSGRIEQSSTVNRPADPTQDSFEDYDFETSEDSAESKSL
ncbi:MAG: alkaline shock response membrane anchor protein AmaP [Opitutales bacterium]|nr:alkaline shock response membrane anchor protein AmaP [Opitutales bacterium]